MVRERSVDGDDVGVGRGKEKLFEKQAQNSSIIIWCK
jgi:hypothetical protein